MKKYSLTDEHRGQLKNWADRWIKNALSTKEMDEEEREICRLAVVNLYKSANMKPPPHERIIFVSSPFIMRFAGGFSSAIWWLRKKNKRDATIDATDAATRAATEAATRAATRDATIDATEDATGDATDAATDAATIAATDAATRAATEDATRDATIAATDAATRVATIAATTDATDAATRAATIAANYDRYFIFPLQMMIKVASLFSTDVNFFLKCAQNINYCWQGGNQWSAWDSYLTFFRDIVKLKIDYSKYNSWIELSEHSGPRIIHEKFCIISDRPRVLKTDEFNRPHCETGPFCEWRDGSKIYAIHGVYVPAWLVEFPQSLTIEKIEKEQNMEVQRIMIERYGADLYLEQIGASVIDEDTLKLDGSAGRVLMKDKKGRNWMVCSDGSTGRVYTLPVSSEATTCKKAHFSICGFDESRIVAEA